MLWILGSYTDRHAATIHYTVYSKQHTVTEQLNRQAKVVSVDDDGGMPMLLKGKYIF